MKLLKTFIFVTNKDKNSSVCGFFPKIFIKSPTKTNKKKVKPNTGT